MPPAVESNVVWVVECLICSEIIPPVRTAVTMIEKCLIQGNIYAGHPTGHDPLEVFWMNESIVTMNHVTETMFSPHIL